MKINYKKVLLVALFPVMGLYLFSCVKNSSCPDPPETITVNLPDNLKSKIPYKGFDTLTFIRKTDGDTHTFIGQGVKRGYDLLRRDGGDEECRSSTGNARMEFISYTFASSTFSSPIYLEMYYLEYPVGTWMTVKFNDKTYETPTTVITKYIYDSITIGTKVFYKATRFANELNPSSTVHFLVYNSEYGILKFRFQTGEEWELLTKP